MKELTIRRATRDDAEPIWKLTNDDSTRAFFLTQRRVPWLEHLEWFTKRLATDLEIIWVGEWRGLFAGYVRYGKDGETHIAVMPGLRGKGIGSKMLELTCGPTARMLGTGKLTARVLVTNERSRKAFERAGYRLSQYVMEWAA